jgi:DNA polymerase-3 subunit delta'
VPLDDVLGQPRALERLRSALTTGTVHHAYLFEGPEGVGKELAAIGLAQALLCKTKPGVGCGTCAVCGRVQRRNHPDVTFVMPEEDMVARGMAGRADFSANPSRDIKVEQVRGLQERLSLRAFEGKRKIAILAKAERMNVQAQNAFLKTLEEPAPDTVLVLLASASDRLLPTLRSRCAQVPFGPLPTQVVVERVLKERKVDPTTAELVAVMSGGSLSRALEMDVESLQRRSELIRLFDGLSTPDGVGILRFAEIFGRTREDAEDALQILALWIRDVAVAQEGGAVLNRDLESLAQATAKRTSAVSLHRKQSLLGQALESITTRNASPRLQLERMLIEMTSA